LPEQGERFVGLGEIGGLRMDIVAPVGDGCCYFWPICDSSGRAVSRAVRRRNAASSFPVDQTWRLCKLHRARPEQRLQSAFIEEKRHDG
jgi:hypothetical protein